MKPKPRRPSQAKALRRSFQVNATRKTGVHPHEEGATHLTGVSSVQESKNGGKSPPMDLTSRARNSHPERHRLQLQPGQPCKGSKLNSQLTEQICSLISQHCTLHDACDALGLSRQIVWEWRGKGQAGEPFYRDFEAAISRALALSKVQLISQIAADKDIKGKLHLLRCRWREEYGDFIRQELSGPDGGAIPLEQTFSVVLELAASAEPVHEQEFRVIEENCG
jgi:hypothetical protein